MRASSQIIYSFLDNTWHFVLFAHFHSLEFPVRLVGKLLFASGWVGRDRVRDGLFCLGDVWRKAGHRVGLAGASNAAVY